MWRKAMLYLGLGPDEEYDDYDPAHDDGTDRQRGAGSPARRRACRRGARVLPDEPSAIGAVRPINVPAPAPRVAASRSSRPAPRPRPAPDRRWCGPSR